MSNPAVPTNATNTTKPTNATNTTNATHATHATNTTNATHATHATNTTNATHATNATHGIQPGMVIEELHFAVVPSDVEQFLEVEGRIWTSFLKTCDGFLRKEIWLPEDEQGKVVVMIWWNTMAQWKSITPEQCDEVDARMGDWLRPISYFKAHNVARVCEGL